MGLAYLSTALGAMISMVAATKTSDTIIKKSSVRGENRPENRLLPMYFFWSIVSSKLCFYA